MLTKFPFNSLKFLPIFLLLLFSCQTSTHSANDTSEILQVLNSQTDQWNQGNIPGFMQGYDNSDSMQFITQRGRTTGWKNVLAKYAKNYPNKAAMGQLSFENLIITPLSDSLSQVYGNWVVKKDSTISGNFSLILKHKPEGWRIIIDHTW